MAILTHGILGGFSGKVGNIVGYRYKNQFCIRQVPRKSLKPPGQKQLAQRAKFKLSLAFISPLRDLLNQLPEKGKRRISAFNSCLSTVLTKVVKGTYPDYSFDYTSLQLSSGRLSVGHCHSVHAAQDHLIFSWCNDFSNECFEGKLVMLAYHPLRKQWISDTIDLSFRDHMAALRLPCSFMSGQIETYMYFIAADGKAVSDSIYPGTVHLPGTSLSKSFINLN